MKCTFDIRVPSWLRRIVEGVSYKPGWSLDVRALEFGYDYMQGEACSYSISAQCEVEDVVTKNRIFLNGPGVTIYREYREEKMVVEMIFRVIRALEEHEMEEQF